MRIVVTGSIAIDQLMTFPGRFTDQLVATHLDQVSLSFLADRLAMHRGGAGANIALGLARLGHSPVLVGAAGADFAEYRADLEREGVDSSYTLISASQHTARFICTTDVAGNQIATFYPGAMSEARQIELPSVAAGLTAVDLVLISPDDPDAMLAHTEECRVHGYPFAADPSQQLARMDGADIRALIGGARYLFTNAYERALLTQKTGWSEPEILAQVACWITTRGPDGARIERMGAPVADIRAVATDHEVDPTGVGDGFRAGFLSGVAWGLPLVWAAQIGCCLATIVLEGSGPQDYVLAADEFSARLRSAYGDEAASAAEPFLRAGALR